MKYKVGDIVGFYHGSNFVPAWEVVECNIIKDNTCFYRIKNTTSDEVNDMVDDILEINTVLIPPKEVLNSPLLKALKERK